MPYSIRKSIALIYFSLIPGFVFSATIDRQALVTRHNPHLTQIDTRSPFTLGNGCFAFTADVDWDRLHAQRTLGRWRDNLILQIDA